MTTTTAPEPAATAGAPLIYTALAAVMAEVDHVSKRDRNEHARFLFRGIDAVVNAVGPALRRHGVIVVPHVISTRYDNVTTSGNKPANACRVEVRYTFYAADGSSIETQVAAEAWDNGDKAAPKAMSVAFRTALLQSLALPTDEPDPDSQTYERANPQQQPAPAERPGGTRQQGRQETERPQRPDLAVVRAQTVAAQRAKTVDALREVWQQVVEAGTFHSTIEDPDAGPDIEAVCSLGDYLTRRRADLEAAA